MSTTEAPLDAIACANQLPEHLQELVATLPPYVSRRQGVELVTRHLFPLNLGTLERWNLPTRRVAREALIETAALFTAAVEALRAAARAA